MKKFLIIAGAIILAALIAAGGFWGGMAYQTNQANQAQANFERARGTLPAGQLPGDRQGPGFLGGGGTTGQVKSIDGNLITLSTVQDVATVRLSETTQIEKTVLGTVADLQPGTRVMVIGQQGSDGNLTASRIRILNDNSFSELYPSPAGTEP